jgi:hypothetical protein
MDDTESDNLRLLSTHNHDQDVDISDETQDFRFLSQFSKYVSPWWVESPQVGRKS